MNNLNITIGQYVKGDSFLYRLDPRFKIIATIVLMIAIFLVPASSMVNLYILLGFLGVLVLIMLCGRVNLLAVIKGLQPIIFIGLFTFLLFLAFLVGGVVRKFYVSVFTRYFHCKHILAPVFSLLYFFPVFYRSAKLKHRYTVAFVKRSNFYRRYFCSERYAK